MADWIDEFRSPAEVIGDSSGILTQLDVMPDGREVLKVGDVHRVAEIGHQQGDNGYGFLGTCGLCSCESVLRQFGIGVTEHDIVDHAVRNGQCAVTDDPMTSGGTTEMGLAQILTDYGVPAHPEQGRSLEDLARYVEEGKGIIVEANAGYLWNDATYLEFGQANHAVVVTGVARDPSSGEVLGVYINDSGAGEFGRFVDAAIMQDAWIDAGGSCVVTDHARPMGQPPA